MRDSGVYLIHMSHSWSVYTPEKFVEFTHILYSNVLNLMHISALLFYSILWRALCSVATATLRKNRQRGPRNIRFSFCWRV